MNYTEIEMEGMKEILRDKEEEIKKLKEQWSNSEKAADAYIAKLEQENKKLKSDLSLVIKERDDNIEQNKKLKEDLAFKNTMLDNVKAEYDNLQDVIKKLKKRVKEHTTYSVKAEFIKKFGE